MNKVNLKHRIAEDGKTSFFSLEINGTPCTVKSYSIDRDRPGPTTITVSLLASMDSIIDIGPEENE